MSFAGLVAIRGTQVVLEQDTGVTRDTDGAPLDGWTTFATVPALKDVLGGSEIETGEGRTASATVRWHLADSAALAAVKPTKFRINEGGVLFDIINVDRKTARGQLHLMTKQRGA